MAATGEYLLRLECDEGVLHGSPCPAKAEFWCPTRMEALAAARGAEWLISHTKNRRRIVLCSTHAEEYRERGYR